ncbi:hypothetical protein NPIL_296701 [Nephila pilipes]|uniref:Uncharacterized protein n=1 Tax=Nephila pilipes TaxID=299642 RepID=A0A8X6QII1_NEPPI|nr:hypothetical protein NPIL_296701 [Nephila pilipes]
MNIAPLQQHIQKAAGNRVWTRTVGNGLCHIDIYVRGPMPISVPPPLTHAQQRADIMGHYKKNIGDKRMTFSPSRGYCPCLLPMIPPLSYFPSFAWRKKKSR